MIEMSVANWIIHLNVVLWAQAAVALLLPPLLHLPEGTVCNAETSLAFSPV